MSASISNELESDKGSTNSSSNSNSTSMEKSIWKKCFSKTHQEFYWFDATTGVTSWTEQVEEQEEEIKPAQKKQRIDEDTSNSNINNNNDVKDDKSLHNISEQVKINIPIKKKQIEIAIIVPYRDLHKEQNRKQQLDLFITSITKFMKPNKSNCVPYKVYVIEQSNDNRKFNRGKLLNIGFKIACKEGCRAFIFHDVDLIPSTG